MVEERADASEESASELFVIARPSRSHPALMWLQTTQWPLLSNDGSAARSDLAFSVSLGDSSAGLRIEVPYTLQQNFCVPSDDSFTISIRHTWMGELVQQRAPTQQH